MHASSNSRLGALIGLLIVVSIFFIASRAHAATPLPPAPVRGWCYVIYTLTGYQDVNACPDEPPPVDPGAYTNVVVKWLNGSNPPQAMTDVTQFWNIFGHILPTLPVQQWPGAGGVTVSMVDNSAKYYRMRFTMPMNPGTSSRFLKAVSYGKSPANLRANFAIVAAAAAWPTGTTTPCWKPSEPFSDQSVLNINPGAPNSSKCSWAPGETKDVLMDAIGNGTMALQWVGG